MTATKDVPALGIETAAFSVPAKLCATRSPHERHICNLAPHARSTAHAAYDQVTDSTITWPAE